MENQNLIPAEECSMHYNIETSFIQLLDKHGFIHLVTIEQKQYIETDQLHELEKFIRMHYELDINVEGIEAINFLLERLKKMRKEIEYLKSKLNVYEEGDFE